MEAGFLRMTSPTELSCLLLFNETGRMKKTLEWGPMGKDARWKKKDGNVRVKELKAAFND